MSYHLFTCFPVEGHTRAFARQQKAKLSRYKEIGVEAKWWRFAVLNPDKKESVFLPNDVFDAMKWMNPQHFTEFLLKNNHTAMFLSESDYQDLLSRSASLFMPATITGNLVDKIMLRLQSYKN